MQAIWRKAGSRWATGLALLALLCLLPLWLGNFQEYVVTLMLVYSIVGVGLDLVMGYAGQISVAHAAFMGVGGYTTALLIGKAHWPLLPALLSATALSAALGFIVGIPALRVRGHYLALATLAFQIMTETIIGNWVEVTHGPNGLRVPTPTLGPWRLKGHPLYFVVLVVAVLVLVFAWNLTRSRVGRALVSIRDQEIAASVMGVDLTWYKTLAFGLSAAYAGLAGGLFGVTVAFLDPSAFSIWESIKQLIMVIFGGIGTIWGPVVGGSLITAAPQLLSGFQERALLVFYALLLLVLIFTPAGVVAGIVRALRRLISGAAPGAQTISAQPSRLSELRLAVPPVHRPDEPLLSVRNVGIHFGGLYALRGVSFDVMPGQIKGLIGPNGAGKTTMFNVLTRLYQPTEGEVRFNGHDLLKHPTHKIVSLGIARTFQNVEIFHSMTVLQNVLMGMHHALRAGLWTSGLRLPGMRREELRSKAEAQAILELVGLGPYADLRADQLPLAMQRRMELARALAARPALLLLDEPASGLSQGEAEQLMGDVRAIRDAGITVLLIEHNMRFVMGVCDSITVLDQGEVICTGTPQEAQQSQRVIEAYLGEEEVAHAGD